MGYWSNIGEVVDQVTCQVVEYLNNQLANQLSS